jgi:hypothetical protein
MNETSPAKVKATTEQADHLVNQASFILFAAALCSWNSCGQTNAFLVPVRWFSVPSPQLRPLTTGAGTPIPVQNARDETSAFPEIQAAPTQRTDANVDRLNLEHPEQLTLSSRPGDFDFRTYRMLEERGYLRRPEPKSDNRFVRFVNGIFEPTPIRLGKTVVTCSIITAIKRKNPLCLINPLVLTVSW